MRPTPLPDLRTLLGVVVVVSSGLVSAFVPQPLRAQDVTEVTITCGESCWTPEERARNEAAKREQARKQAEFNRKVDAQLAKMGGNPARRAEAERFVRMQEDAQKAREKIPKRSCTSRTWSQPVTTSGRTRDSAFASLTRMVSNRSGCDIGGSESVLSMTLGTAASCSERVLPQWPKPPPVGKCLACMDEKLAIRMGYVPGKGWPPPEKEWVCKATASCAAEKCGTGSSAVSSQ